MGFGNFGIWELLILLVIVALIFGTSKLKGMGKDLGGAVKTFREGLQGVESDIDPKNTRDSSLSSTTQDDKQD